MKKTIDLFDIMMEDEGKEHEDYDDDDVNSEGNYIDCGDDNLL